MTPRGRSNGFEARANPPGYRPSAPATLQELISMCRSASARGLRENLTVHSDMTWQWNLCPIRAGILARTLPRGREELIARFERHELEIAVHLNQVARGTASLAFEVSTSGVAHA